jgi:hypothetical protein
VVLISSSKAAWMNVWPCAQDGYIICGSYLLTDPLVCSVYQKQENHVLCEPAEDLIFINCLLFGQMPTSAHEGYKNNWISVTLLSQSSEDCIKC